MTLNRSAVTRVPVEHIGQHDIVMQTIYCSLAIVGIVGNSVAIAVMSRSKAIRNTRSYILLLSQSIVDLFTCLNIFVMMASGRWYDDQGHWGTLGTFVCLVWVSDYTMTTSVAISSYNLVALSIERTVSIVFPIFHRSHVTRRVNFWMAVTAWMVGIVTQLAFMIPTTGLQEGRCNDWGIFPDDTWKMAFGVSLFVLTYALPVGILVVCYSWIYVEIRRRSKTSTGDNIADPKDADKAKVRRNVLRTLVVVVACYLFCNSPKSLVYIAYRFGAPIRIDTWVFQVPMIMNFANSVVNPIVYTFQYREYQNELQRWWNICRGVKDDEDACGGETSIAS